MSYRQRNFTYFVFNFFQTALTHVTDTMKVKRQKRVGKILKYFHLNFGFRKPFNLVLDGTFCATCLETKVNIKEQIPKYVIMV